MSQTDRLREYARSGMTKAEACDREGCSHGTAESALKETDLKWTDPKTLPRHSWDPQGTKFDKSSNFQAVFQRYLDQLRSQYPSSEVARLTGMNLGQQVAALDPTKGHTYNWTIAQITRLAEAHGKTTYEVLEEALDIMKRGL